MKNNINSLVVAPSLIFGFREWTTPICIVSLFQCSNMSINFFQVKIIIEKHNLIEIIMRTILSESDVWKNSRGTLVFQRQRDNESYAVFKRVQFALFDLK